MQFVLVPARPAPDIIIYKFLEKRAFIIGITLKRKHIKEKLRGKRD